MELGIYGMLAKVNRCDVGPAVGVHVFGEAGSADTDDQNVRLSIFDLIDKNTDDWRAICRRFVLLEPIKVK